MKPTQFGLCVVAAFAVSACATTVDPNAPATGDLLLRGSGAGNWMVECTAQTTHGESSPSMDGIGSGNTGIIAVDDVTSASCTYAAGNRPFTLTLEDEGLSCPFGDFNDGLCREQIAAGSEGSFDFSVE